MRSDLQSGTHQDRLRRQSAKHEAALAANRIWFGEVRPP